MPGAKPAVVNRRRFAVLAPSRRQFGQRELLEKAVANAQGRSGSAASMRTPAVESPLARTIYARATSAKLRR